MWCLTNQEKEVFQGEEDDQLHQVLQSGPMQWSDDGPLDLALEVPAYLGEGYFGAVATKAKTWMEQVYRKNGRKEFEVTSIDRSLKETLL